MSIFKLWLSANVRKVLTGSDLENEIQGDIINYEKCRKGKATQDIVKVHWWRTALKERKLEKKQL